MNAASPKTLCQSLPDFLQFLMAAWASKAKLHKEVLGYDLYLIDLSGWKLRFSDRTPGADRPGLRPGRDECPGVGRKPG